MDDKKIEEIIQKVFARAKQECVSHTKHALSKHIEDKIQLSSKTIERTYDRYINKREYESAPNAVSINLFCQYLGYEDYEDYIKNNGKNEKPIPLVEESEGKQREGVDIKKGIKNSKWILTIVIISIVFTAFFISTPWIKDVIFDDTSISNTSKSVMQNKQCMTWMKTHYKEVSCTKKYSTKVEPLDAIRLTNFKKVEVSMTTDFFDEETNKPLIWYYKNKEGELEYFTAPGLHPINGETLRKITTHIIKTYVPLHVNNEDSYLKNDTQP